MRWLATARRLALAAGELRQRVEQGACDGRFGRPYAAFRRDLIAGAEPAVFADAVAQTTACRAIAARLYPALAGHDLLPRCLRRSLDVPAGAPFDGLVADLELSGGEEDALLGFYEDFLAAYDPAARKRFGVFNTPRPLAEYVVRSVDECLRSEFGCALGLADTSRRRGATDAGPGAAFVQILDPAVGTGTFLVSAIGLIHERMREHWQQQGKSTTPRWQRYVRQHLLPRLHGYELMPAPYAIAHIAIALKLRATGYVLGPADRLGLCLTNALEAFRPGPQLRADGVPSEGVDFRRDALSARTRAAGRSGPARDWGLPTVILGNPPYAALSANLTPACRSAVDGYRQVAGVPIRERGMLQFEKNLQDDYVKFFARAEQAIVRAGAGVVGFVTNHSFLDGPTLRGLRWSLADSFDRIRVVDLHGGINKKERAPEGGRDENLFGIRQGVAVSLLRRLPQRSAELCRIERIDLWGTRPQKLEQLQSSLRAEPVTLTPPDYLFVAAVGSSDAIWEAAVPLPAAFVKCSTGTETGFDELLLDFERARLLDKVRSFADPATSPAELRRQYAIGGGHAEELLGRRRNFEIDKAERYCTPLQFRPFDLRHGYLKKDLLKTNSFNVMTEISPERPGLIATRQTKERFGVFVTGGFCGHKCISAYDRSYVFPSGAGFTEALGSFGRDATENFHYLYAILRAPSYQHRFRSRLTREFPRIPRPARSNLIPALARLGGELVQLHLLRTTAEAGPRLLGKGPPRIEAGFPRFESGRVYLNAIRWFEGVPTPVWDAHVGAFQVCYKWLKDRRGRVLRRAEVDHYRRIVAALDATRRLEEEIDGAIESAGGWQAAFVAAAR